MGDAWEAATDLDQADCRRLVEASDHAILATLHPTRGADLVPACFTIDGDLVAIPIEDVKPKRSTILGRQRNLERDPRATLLCERWDPDDWSRLWWVRLELRQSTESAEHVRRSEALLRVKYRQYTETTFAAILTFRIVALQGWSAAVLTPLSGGPLTLGPLPGRGR
jgi:hypothetical protein